MARGYGKRREAKHCVAHSACHLLVPQPSLNLAQANLIARFHDLCLPKAAVVSECLHS
ncbi:hypothetical protein BQ8794_50146 [Mesorhizobium prunaredense]|uniref:Uncharacterized protein n=1 Tax=Mesorhizobium prunaredense TaxID=1631249 RepID=A0A1R3VDU7_9HYPH|nr:hypothetical protein BQ8794_50146 [Mesorhizobium prunaredense]